MEFEEYRTAVMNELHHHKQETDQLQIVCLLLLFIF